METATSLMFNLARDFGKNTVDKGERYWRQGRVVQIEFDEDERVLTGQVQGSESEPYDVVVEFEGKLGQIQAVVGSCSCPVGIDCKHASALVSAAIGMKLFTYVQPTGSKTRPIPPTQLSLLPTPENIALPPLDQRSAVWLDALQRTRLLQETASDDDVPEILVYVLNLDSDPNGTRQLTVETRVVRKNRSGSFSKGKAFHGDRHSNARYVHFEDREYLSLIALHSEHHYHSNISKIRPEHASRLLIALIASGRCYWNDTSKPPLSVGGSRTATHRWVDSNNGNRQRIQFDSAELPFETVLPFDPPWYVDSQRNECGPLRTGLPDAMAGLLARAPEIPAKSAQRVAERLVACTGEKIELPKKISVVQRPATTNPQPCLTLIAAKTDRYYSTHENLRFCATLAFDYEGHRVLTSDNENVVTFREHDTLVYLERNKNYERAMEKILDSYGFHGAYVKSPGAKSTNIRGFELNTSDPARAAMAFIAQTVPELRNRGWIIEFAPDFPWQPLNVDEWYLDVSESSGIDWFGAELGVVVQGERINLVPILLRLLTESNLDALTSERGAALMVPYKDKVIVLPKDRLTTILETISELFNGQADRDGRLLVNRLRAAQIAELSTRGSGSWQWRGSPAIQTLSQRLRDFSGVHRVAPPAMLRTQLRDYQQQGLNWLQFLREYDLGGILADDMGLGKTVQALAHIAMEKEQGRLQQPALIIAPTSLVPNWRNEAAKFTPELSVLTWHGLQRKDQKMQLAQHDIVVTTYPLLVRDYDLLRKKNYHLLILDEAQVIKNAKSKISQMVRAFKARHRLCLTGTPMENHLGELWSQFDFLMPGFLGDEKEFKRIYRGPIEKFGNPIRRAALRKRIAPLMLRRTKQDVAKELPPKSEIVREIELTDQQRDLYETVRLTMHEKVRKEIAAKGFARSHILILDALLKLRQVCCDPRLVKITRAREMKTGAKMELLLEMLPDLIADGRRVLLFSQFTSMLELIEAELEKIALPYVKLTGDTRDRDTPVKQFQSGAVPLFLISLKAGGTGLNLTAADVVIHFDPWWNPAVADQATDRAYRIGQDKPVFVYKLVTSGTVEEKILQLQKRKKDLAQGVYGEGEQQSTDITAQDLDVLFAPLAVAGDD